MYSTASNDVVQPQPAAGSCHALGSGLYSRPDPRCTPGALNPAVRQGTIGSTICQSGWTSTVRPAESITEAEKGASLAAYGDNGPLSSYEYDHFVPLELGGATNDPRNLWPEPGATPNPKDTVENDLRRAVCDGQMTLAAAQRAIAANWTRVPGYPAGGSPSAGATPGGSGSGSVGGGSAGGGSGGAGAHCTVTANYSPSYHDYDVYVHSNVPDQTVTVSDADGHSSSWHTNSSGYADVYFKSGGYAPGRQVTARVGGASCTTTL